MECKSEVMTYIGTLDVPRPSSRAEIVAAMRRIRYEFKAKAIKKKKVVLTVSVDGVKVTLRKSKKQKPQWSWDDSRLLVMQHPIYRIFYVSHDSQDLKIWSYIARDGPSNIFRCNVFKAYKKSQAMRIVRTIGQAFEVCHKLGASPPPPATLNKEEENSERSSNDDNDRRTSKNKDCTDMNEEKELNTKTPETEKISPSTNLVVKQNIPLQSPPQGSSTPGCPPPPYPVQDTEHPQPASSDSRTAQQPGAAHHHMHLVKQQLEHQQHQTQVAMAQVHLLKDQLSAETAARIEAQARAHQLLLHNKDLLSHMTQLVSKLQELEVKVTGVSQHRGDFVASLTTTQLAALPDATTPGSAPVYLPDFSHTGHDDPSHLSAFTNHSDTYENTKVTVLDAESPDSGIPEMSSENLSFSSAGQGWNPNFFNLSPVKQGPRNPFDSSFNSTSADRKGDGSAGDNSRFIRPLSFQDSTGRHTTFKLSPPNPASTRIEPPPRVQRSSSRNVDRSERGSWYRGGERSTSTPSSEPAPNGRAPDMDYFPSAYMGNNSTNQRQGHVNGNTSGHGLHAQMQYESGTRAPVYGERNRDSAASLSSLRQKLDLKVSEVNRDTHSGHGRQGSVGGYGYHGNNDHHDHHNGGHWKMRISYTSDDNSDNSDDMNVVSRPPSMGINSQKNQLSALDDFDSMCA